MLAYAALLQFLVLLLINKQLLKAQQCNACLSANALACVSETTYQFCINNIPSGAVNSCPTGYICSTATTVICMPNVVGVVATCNQCNRCDPNNVFACTGVITYALCLGQTTPSTISTGSCGANQVCSLTTPQICANSTITVATCPTGGVSTTSSAATTSSTATTTSSPTTATAATTATTSTTATTATTAAPTLTSIARNFCSTMRLNGRFSVPSTVDNNSCRRYIQCFRIAGISTWSGQMYTCPGSTYFNSTLSDCVQTRPANC